MANNKNGLNKLCSETLFYLNNVDLNEPENLNEFLQTLGVILFNDVSASVINNFNDGVKSAAYLNIIQYLLKAAAGNNKAYERLLIDLEIQEVNLTIKKIE